MNKRVLIFLLLITFCNCKNKQSDFEAYWSKLPVIKLPLNIQCGLNESDTMIDRSLIKKYAFETALVLGRIEDSRNIYIVYCDPGDICYPYLYTYNKEGKKLDSLYLHISACGEDDISSLSTFSVIEPDKSIEMLDTLRSYDIDTVADKRYLIKTVFTKRIYKMDEAGIPKMYSERKDSTASHTYIP